MSNAHPAQFDLYPSLIDYFCVRKPTRQIIIITHNPNLVACRSEIVSTNASSWI